MVKSAGGDVLQCSAAFGSVNHDVSERIAECIVAFEDIWERKGIDLNVDLDENLTVTADPELMTVVWNNLISNALKFTEPGGSVTVTGHRAGPWVEVSVSDTGCGMDEKTGRHIFDKFYQGDTSHATEGNGLGLAMVKRIVDLWLRGFKILLAMRGLPSD